MPQNLLEQLRKYTVVVADTGDIEAMEKFRPTDATTNPSLITTASQMPQYQEIVDGVLKEARDEKGGSASDKDVAKLAFERLAVAFGKKILAIVPGRVSTEVDARLSYDTEATLTQARAIIAQYDKAGIDRKHILIKIASTWPGIRAAEILEKEGIHCNLTLLFGIHQAVACAEARVTLVSPFVGRILDWFKKDTGKDYQGADDPGVQSVTKIYNYFKKFDYKTQVMGASFRNIGEIKELAGSDLLTISPQLLAELESTEADLPRKLDPANAKSLPIEKIPMDEATFERMHAEDRMAHDKLKEGIEGFSDALVKLENLLANRLAQLEQRTPAHA
ncbi:MAG TPA: transaldolase [Terracidiphilus sp.]|jgi:transaldolase